MAQEGINTKTDLLLIGGSAGSLETVLHFLPMLKKDISYAVLIIMHRKTDAESMLAELLQSRTLITVREVEDKDKIVPAVIYIAPANYHVLVEKEGYFSLDVSEKINYSRPSIDVSFETAADVYGPKAVGLLLSGANADGTAGLKSIKEAGGKTLIQKPSSAEVSFMPQQALKEIEPDAVLEPDEIAQYMNNL